MVDEQKTKQNLGMLVPVGIVSGLVGIIGGLVIASVCPPDIENISVFYDSARTPATVMRAYRFNARDGVFVSDNSNTYIPIGEYLATLPTEAERNLQEAGILKVVNWYDEEPKK